MSFERATSVALVALAIAAVPVLVGSQQPIFRSGTELVDLFVTVNLFNMIMAITFVENAMPNSINAWSMLMTSKFCPLGRTLMARPSTGSGSCPTRKRWRRQAG